MKISNFINELGNKIKIKIKYQKDTGTNYKSKEKIHFTGVNISIFGPTSLTENTITRKEAEELYLTLRDFLKNS